MLGQIAQPQTPQLLVDLPFRRVAVLVQGLQITEDPHELFAGNAQFFGIHVAAFSSTLKWSRVGRGDLRISASDGWAQWYADSTWPDAEYTVTARVFRRRQRFIFELSISL